MKKFSIIVAVDDQMGIGRSNALPWRLSRDMQRFKDVTIPAAEGKQNAVLMGRKTWESLPPKYRPLPGRLNMVLSSRSDIVLPPGVLSAASFDDALAELERRHDVADVFVIGGGVVFALAIGHPNCHKLYLTRVKGSFSCDVFFPSIGPEFKLIKASAETSEGDLSFKFLDLLRS